VDQQASLYAGFLTARDATRTAHPDQTPWLDDNGNGIANEASDGQEAGQRGFAYVGTLPGETWPPYIAEGIGPTSILQHRGVVRARVLDDDNRGVPWVWAVIYPPSYQPPPTSEEWPDEQSPTIVLLDQHDGWYAASYPGFDELGRYRIVLHAKDNEGLEARPVSIMVRTGPTLYLPLVEAGYY